MSSDILGWVTKDGSSGFKAEKNRYHLYVSYGCPFAHRTILALKIKGLEDVISVDNTASIKSDPEIGFNFSPEFPDTINGKEYLRDVYFLSHPEYSGSYTVPVLFDKQTKKIVSNSSADILRMLNSEFNELASKPELDLYPENLKTEIDGLNEWIAPEIIYAVYRVGRAMQQENQELYLKEVNNLFNALDKVETILATKRYLAGNQLTEADVRLFVVLLRFDPVYYPLFRCSKKPLILYKNIWAYFRDVYQTYDLNTTINLHLIKTLYFKNASKNAVVPVGPELNYNEPHGRS